MDGYLRHIWQDITPFSWSYSTHSYFVFHCGRNKGFAGYHTSCFWSEFHLQQLAHRHSTYTDLQQPHLLSFAVWSQSSRGSLKETKQNTFVTSHVLHVRASSYMFKPLKDQSGSHTSPVHIECLANILFAYSPMYLLLTPSWHRW